MSFGASHSRGGTGFASALQKSCATLLAWASSTNQAIENREVFPATFKVDCRLAIHSEHWQSRQSQWHPEKCQLHAAYFTLNTGKASATQRRASLQKSRATLIAWASSTNQAIENRAVFPATFEV